jgi:serine/threonine-protein kinase
VSAGETFGRYALGAPIGRGKMAEVRLAVEALPGGGRRPCVVKRVAAPLSANPRFVEMFREEMRLATRLVHPNIACAFEAGEIDGVPFIAFERIDGATLREVHQAHGGPLAVPAVLAIGLEVARALDYAHLLADSEGRPLEVVHRDISPDNVLLTSAGAIKVIDFGIARFRDRDHHTRHGEIKGKLRYLAPEQAEQKAVDARTDLFALGITLAELLGALKPPFTHSFTREVVDEPGDLAPEVHRLLRRLTAADPEARLPSARALIEALEGLGADPGALASLAGRAPRRGSTMIDWQESPTEEASLPKLPPRDATTLIDRTLPPAGPARAKPRNTWALPVLAGAGAALVGAVVWWLLRHRV